MNLSSIIHNEHRASHSRHQKPFDQHQTLQRLPNYTNEGNMASVLTHSPYTSQPHLFTHPPNSPSSPPVSEDSSAKRLPSIQSLIEMSEPGSASNERKSSEFWKSAGGCSYLYCSWCRNREAVSAFRRESIKSRSPDNVQPSYGGQIRLWNRPHCSIAIGCLVSFFNACGSILRSCHGQRRSSASTAAPTVFTSWANTPSSSGAIAVPNFAISLISKRGIFLLISVTRSKSRSSASNVLPTASTSHLSSSDNAYDGRAIDANSTGGIPRGSEQSLAAPSLHITVILCSFCRPVAGPVCVSNMQQSVL